MCPQHPVPFHQHLAAPRRPVRRALLAAVLGAPLVVRRTAHAQGHRGCGLVMGIADYGDPGLDLPGVQLDLQRALQMAHWLGCGGRLQVLADRALTLMALETALNNLARQAEAEDLVFVYFSGHGRQIDGTRQGARCSEGLVTADGQLYLDAAIVHHLQRIAGRARQVLMLSDTCHAGGLATKHAGARGPEVDAVPKVYRRDVALPGAPGRAAGCGQAVNKTTPPSLRPGAWLHVAAAAADEVAWTTPRGSYATEAWHEVFAASLRAGRLDGATLRDTAQARLDALRRRQNMALSGLSGMAWRLTS